MSSESPGRTLGDVNVLFSSKGNMSPRSPVILDGVGQ